MTQPAPQPAREPLTDRARNWFTYHAPNAEQVEQYRRIRDAGLAFAEVIIAECPESADQTVAIRCVREAVMWANASIACGGK